MGVFVRGRTWWMEWKGNGERVVMSTGVGRDEAGGKAKAEQILAAYRLGRGVRPPRSVLERLLESIYGRGRDGIRLADVWDLYRGWLEDKGRELAARTVRRREAEWGRFLEWARSVGKVEVEQVDVSVARMYVRHLRQGGAGNKTVRDRAGTLGGIWRALESLFAGIHNPWTAATPDNDGSSVRREAFSRDEEERILAAAREVGHGWYLASLIARWTGLRYGDIARLEWRQVDLARGVVAVVPNKTKRSSGVRLTLPVARELAGVLADAKAAAEAGAQWVLPEHALAYPCPMSVPFSDVLRSAGLDERTHTFHSWRHTFRTRLAEAGVSDDLARRLGGWSNLEMAAHYDHAERVEELRGAIEATGMTKGDKE